jgi:hypothetical protein
MIMIFIESSLPMIGYSLATGWISFLLIVFICVEPNEGFN